MVGKIYAGILVDRLRKGLLDDEQGWFRAGSWCIDQIFALRQLGEKARKKKCSVCGFYGPREGL